MQRVVWSREFEAECTKLLCAVIGARPRSREQMNAWHAFLGRTHPHIERWCRNNPQLRAFGLADEHPREVMVRVLARLSDEDFADLRAFVAWERALRDGSDDRSGPVSDSDATTLAEAAALLGTLEDPDEEANPESVNTPLRQWLIGVVRNAAWAHVRSIVGRDGKKPRMTLALRGGPQTVEQLDADIRTAPGPVSPLTLLVQLQLTSKRRALIQEILTMCKPEQVQALALLVEGLSIDEIAEEMKIAKSQVVKLLRAGRQRLRRELARRDPGSELAG